MDVVVVHEPRRLRQRVLGGDDDRGRRRHVACGQRQRVRGVEAADEIQIRHDAPDQVLHATAVAADAIDDDAWTRLATIIRATSPIGVSGRHDSTPRCITASTVVVS